MARAVGARRTIDAGASGGVADTTGPIPIDADDGGVVLDVAAGGGEQVLSELTHDLSGMSVCGVHEGVTDGEVAVSFEEPIGDDQKAITRFELQSAGDVGVGGQAERQARGPLVVTESR